jgi:hypothetical protein
LAGRADKTSGVAATQQQQQQQQGKIKVLAN